MTYKIVVYGALCATSKFTINGISADSSDFGEGYDASPEDTEDYCCGNRVFERKESTEEVLEKYGITEEEYGIIADELCSKLSFGSCGCCS